MPFFAGPGPILDLWDRYYFLQTHVCRSHFLHFLGPNHVSISIIGISFICRRSSCKLLFVCFNTLDLSIYNPKTLKTSRAVVCQLATVLFHTNHSQCLAVR